MTPRHQIFADAKLRGETDTEAATTAGYAVRSAYNQGHRLMRNDEIIAYIALQRAQAAQNAALSVEWVLEALQADRLQATALGQPAAATTAAVHIGKHLGMWPNKITITDADREAARIAAAALGLDESAVLAEVERELKEARA